VPDIWVGEKVTTTVVVVNEEVIPWLNAVGVERSVVLGTFSTTASWSRLNGLNQTRRKVWRHDALGERR